MTINDLKEEVSAFDNLKEFTLDDLNKHIEKIENAIVDNPGYAYLHFNDNSYEISSIVCKESEINTYLKTLGNNAMILVNRNGKCCDLGHS